MIKTVLKEIVITILLFVAIILILAVIFYDYNPINKIVPNKVAYTTPNNVKNEVEEKVTELERTNIVYTIDGSTLETYKKIDSYIPGKANPFSTLADGGNNNNNNNNNNNSTNTTQNTNNTDTNKQNTNPDSTGTFFNNTGKK